MDTVVAKADLHRYLRTGRDALLWKLDGLSGYDARRPMTPTGTSLLGLVKHVASMGCLYLGDCIGEPRPDVPWLADGAAEDADIWVTADESRAVILEFWDAAWTAADAAVEKLHLDAPAVIRWWPEERRHTTLHTVLVHLIAEVDRHAGHADILRELIDGATGFRPDNVNVSASVEWSAHRDRVEAAARTAVD